MKITEKINFTAEQLHEYGPINIVVLGDSVSHGMVAAGEIDYETVYWERLRKKILAVRNYTPVNVINAAIGGSSAVKAIPRLDSQVFCHNPDLIIVCFGLNDVNGELDEYIDSLRVIFSRCLEGGFDTVFMTPNMLNTHFAEGTPEQYIEYAHKTAEMQCGGRMDLYIGSAVRLAEEMGITVCDCYAEWKKLSETEDVTMLLANRINHPTKEMHELFANMLFDTIFADAKADAAEESGMYSK